jgi:hypothetical protein
MRIRNEKTMDIQSDIVIQTNAISFDGRLFHKWEVVLQKIFRAHARAVMQMCVNFSHIAKITMGLVLFKSSLLDATIEAA